MGMGKAVVTLMLTGPFENPLRRSIDSNAFFISFARSPLDLLLLEGRFVRNR